MSSIKKISLFFLVLALGISSGKAGEWNDLIQKGDGEKAREIAYSKYCQYRGNYDIYALPHIGKITNYINNSLPHLNTDAVSFGVHDFFGKKINKWGYRINLLDQLLNNPFASITSAAPFKNRIDTNYKTSLPYACQKSVDIFFHQQAIKGLEEIGVHAKGQTKPDSEISTSAENLLKVLKVGKVSKEEERLQKLHTNLNNKLLGLMGIEPEHLSKHFEKKSIVKVIDQTFKKYIKGEDGWDIPYSIENQQALPFPDNALEWGHGDVMAGLINFFSPESEIRRIAGLALSSYAFQNESQPKDASIVFNCSFITASPRYAIRKEGQNIHWTYNQGQIAPVKYYKEYFANNFPNENCNGPLSDKQVAYLQESESKEDKLKTIHAKYLAAGLNGEKDNLLIASPINTSGVLDETGFHDGSIHLLNNDDLTKEHALVALNWDFTTEALFTDSKSAGEYKDMAVVVPSAYVSVADNQTANKTSTLPYFLRGGHSSATAMLSAVISCVRGHYPELTYSDVKRAILQGANKNIPGYNEDLHGQGMLNLTGALAEAEKIISSSKAENSSI